MSKSSRPKLGSSRRFRPLGRKVLNQYFFVQLFIIMLGCFMLGSVIAIPFTLQLFPQSASSPPSLSTPQIASEEDQNIYPKPGDLATRSALQTRQTTIAESNSLTRTNAKIDSSSPESYNKNHQISRSTQGINSNQGQVNFLPPDFPSKNRTDITFVNIKAKISTIPLKTIALTFDDGPSPEYTFRVLEKLHKYNVKATFFLVGYRVEENCSLVKLIINEGHEIGNHTYDHPFLTDLTEDQQYLEITRTQKSISECLGNDQYRPIWFRPPYGSTNSATFDILKKLGLNSIVWSIDTVDWRNTSTPKSIADLILGSKGQDIVLMHDATDANPNFINPKSAKTRDATIASLDLFLDKMQSDQLKFVRLSDAFNSQLFAQSTAIYDFGFQS